MYALPSIIKKITLMPLDSEFTIKPPRLVPGDTIGIIAPSSPFDKQKFHDGLVVIEEMGFSVFFPENIFEQKGYLAGSDVQRANDCFLSSNQR